VFKRIREVDTTSGGAVAFSRDVAIVGGCGRVGLPLGLALADSGLSVTLYDRAERTVEGVRAGKMPFREDGAQRCTGRLRGACFHG
jgi:UDP-N-acetyl-D-mannosaminuronic acid dehydrogenase